ncbi:GntR family transcriptional regulator [Synechococcus sp. PCC 7336]|uniref:GntR family transcriptional regulator n=1 Tax=Synechococcus sp. PCC 7336 TaxID=195250 RepID=UPI000349BB25|nr:GntR family transcriptional regulator [Synechococcus sp. PCC 7336]
MQPKFYIQPQSDSPASAQLASQIAFAIASNQFKPGSRLPSTRQLAMQTGLHRNTISRVYSQLEAQGLIEARAGSGMYVREGISPATDPADPDENSAATAAQQILQAALDGLGQLGYSLAQIQTLLLDAIAWRQQCSAQAIVTVPQAQQGVARLLEYEFSEELGLSVQSIVLEALSPVLAENSSVTLVTTRYFLQAVETVAAPYRARVIPIDVNTYERELEAIAQLPAHSCVGIVSISPEIAQVAEVIACSRFGDERLIVAAPASDRFQLEAIARRAELILCGRSSLEAVKAAVREVRSHRIRLPEIVASDPYISEHSRQAIAREFGLSSD